jgi:hypothetical protein
LIHLFGHCQYIRFTTDRCGFIERLKHMVKKHSGNIEKFFHPIPMYKKVLFAFSFTGLLIQSAYAQQLLGIANSNYAGTNGVYMNPSSIADSRHGFYLNFFTFDGHITNNYLRFTGPDLAQSLADDYFGKDDQYLQERLNGKPKMFTMAADVRLPSFMLKLSPKHSFAFVSRMRTAVQGNNISEDILRAFRYGTDKESLQNVFNNSHFNFNVNSFIETGLTYGRVMIDKDKHFVKGGLTVKRLYGVYSAHLINKDLGYTIKEDAGGSSMLHIQSLNTQMGYSRDQFDIDYSSILNRQMPGKGWGFDMGFTYEYRPDIDEYRYTMDGKERLDNRKNKYKFRFGAALMDVGGIRYNNAGLTRSYNVIRHDVTITSEDLENTSADRIDDLLVDLLDIKPSEQTNSFRSALPTALNFNLDYRIANRLYVNTSIIQNVRGRYAIGMRQNSMVTVTPRIEMKWLELAFPLSMMNNYGDFAFGTMLKLGPVFVGSDNIGGFINSGKPFGANIYAGMALPIFKGKKKDKDKDGVSNRKDQCKTVAGNWEFMGCPDSDGDGVQDSQDACPALAGLVALKGCPDTDGDGIADAEDKCPTEAGLAKFTGCPDTDNDNIIDSEDNCPSVAGLAQFNGCPDKNGDGIADKED